jgi:membrane-bound lytic murein transglycosylase D
MSVKKTTISFLLLLSIPLFSQEVAENKGIDVIETKLSYLDSIKKTFVNDQMASCVDSLWTKELTDLDLYNEITSDIASIDSDVKVDYELSTELLKSRLESMNAKSPFRIQYNPGLENIIKSFLKNRKKSFERLMATSEYYFPMFEEAFARKNVPLEIKYLAIVESALNPKAVSKMGATGIWQFMYHTGKQYNLKIDSYVDERSDPLKASEAAAQYMSNMYAIFGDWELVLASYNSGPGNVSKAIRRSGGQQSFWDIRKHLPKETQGYVPAFLATMYLYEYRKEHGIKPNKAPLQHFATDTILIKKQMSFKQIADLMDVPVSQLQLLNPSYKLNVIPFYPDQNHYLRLPKDKIALFTSNEDKVYAYVQHDAEVKEKPFQTITTTTTTAVARTESSYVPTEREQGRIKYYKVQRGDNLSAIANKYDVALADLKRWNNLSGNAIGYGKSLKIITSESQAVAKNEPVKEEIVAQATAKQTNAVAESKAKKSVSTDTLSTNQAYVYVVQKGESLFAIAKRYKVSVAEIIKWNHLEGSDVHTGTTLQLKEKLTPDAESKEELASTAELKNIEYVVKAGDNLGNIAKKFGTSLADLKEWNNLSDNTIALGKTLIVAKDEVKINTDRATVNSFKKKDYTGVAKSVPTDYYVKKGDSLYSIAKKYPGVSISDLKKWNDIRGEELKPGMKLKINNG